MTRAMRSDARRNYERLLEEAKRAFLERGVDASLEEIARRAGVGIGTLYRHFPTREALLETLLRERFADRAAAAEELLDHPSPLDALKDWSKAMVEATVSYRGLTGTVADAMNDPSSDLHAACHAMRSAVARLVDRARAAGELRGDVTVTEVLLMVHSAAWASERAPDGGPSLDRLLDLVFTGLRAR
ncbi:TetR/AcrR family transcriptional regulator [Amycolatopsis taiwanensis]|uniref:TetR/AcrR family transcriptional regulator n=1 Tax=Amycolatopsis taiwanensis TaxID=342230 RepID=UPI000484B5E6|nr:TetR/AcrR family transcriptional regulator [Amycolatopsis taiwanensis]